MVQEGDVALIQEDSITEADTLAQLPEEVYGILLTPPEPIQPAPHRSGRNEGVSFILGGLFILFLVISLRFRNNFKYAITIFRNLIETRTRHNVFDDTVRETSLLVMLNILWCACAGIIGYCVYQYLNPETEVSRAIGMLWGMCISTIYALFMWGAYASVGNIFGDSEHTALWVKGFSSSQALMAPALFLTALIGVCRPETALNVGIVSAIVFILVKITFIWQGFRIFFNQFSSWVLFLCYLCSLEIVPLILCYRSAVLLGDIL